MWLLTNKLYDWYSLNPCYGWSSTIDITCTVATAGTWTYSITESNLIKQNNLFATNKLYDWCIIGLFKLSRTTLSNFFGLRGTAKAGGYNHSHAGSRPTTPSVPVGTTRNAFFHSSIIYSWLVNQLFNLFVLMEIIF